MELGHQFPPFSLCNSSTPAPFLINNTPFESSTYALSNDAIRVNIFGIDEKVNEIVATNK